MLIKSKFCKFNRFWILIFQIFLTSNIDANILEGNPIANNSKVALYIGCGDLDVFVKLHNQGQRLVRGICSEPQRVVTLQANLQEMGLYGLVGVSVPANMAQLPYGNKSIDLVVIDNDDALFEKGLTFKEISRILVPGGSCKILPLNQNRPEIVPISVLRPKDSSMLVVMGLAKKTATEEMEWIQKTDATEDSWSHFDHGPDGNALSNDAVGVANKVSWRDVRGYTYKHSLGGFRSDAGRVYYVMSVTNNTSENKLVCRNVYNGALLWEQSTEHGGADRGSFTAGGGKLFLVYKSTDSCVTALDGATGKIAMRYTQAKFEKPANEKVKGTLDFNAHRVFILYLGKQLVIAAYNKISVLDAATGDLIWEKKEASSLWHYFPVVAKDLNYLFVVRAQASSQYAANRWPTVLTIDNIVSYELSGGVQKWVNSEIKGRPATQLFYNEGTLGLGAAAAIGGCCGEHANGGYASIDAASGHGRWASKLMAQDWNVGAYNAVIRSGTMFMMNLYGAKMADVKTGATKTLNMGENLGCCKGVLTREWMTREWVCYINSKFQYLWNKSTRPSCAQTAIPMYGQWLYTRTGCTCNSWLNGYLAMAGGSVSLTEGASKWIKDAEKDKSYLIQPISTSILRKQGIHQNLSQFYNTSPILNDWNGHEQSLAGKKTALLKSSLVNDYSFNIDNKTLTVDILKRDSAIARITVGGRIQIKPLVHEGVAYVGSDDGYVYAINLSNGNGMWRFSAAPAEQYHLVNSQFESSWPVTHLSVENGILQIKAGLSPDLEGVYSYKLKSDGTVLSKEVNQTGSISNVKQFQLVEDQSMTAPEMKPSLPKFQNHVGPPKLISKDAKIFASVSGSNGKVTVVEASGKLIQESALLPNRLTLVEISTSSPAKSGWYFVTISDDSRSLTVRVAITGDARERIQIVDQ